MNGLRFLLDTNIISDLIRHPEGAAQKRLASVGVETVATSAVVASELRFGYRRRNSDRLAILVEFALERMQILPYDDKASSIYASVRTELERRGQVIGPNDLLIAAHARSLDLTLVTDNIREFSRIDGLKLENWIERPAA
jgi:tRNA(fMet)-specific endonuclease VapC